MVIKMVNVLGTDIKDTWSFVDGDLEIVTDMENLEQACTNRLNTNLEFYQWCYDNYGGDLFKVIGMVNNDHALEYLRIEVETILKQDPRIREVQATCYKNDPISIYADIDILTINSEEMVTVNLVINEDYKVKINNKGEEDGTNR